MGRFERVRKSFLPTADDILEVETLENTSGSFADGVEFFSFSGGWGGKVGWGVFWGGGGGGGEMKSKKELFPQSEPSA